MVYPNIIIYICIMEEWRIIKGYDGLYQVSNYGRVKSFKFGKEKILKPGIDGKGYYIISLSLDNIRKTYLIHRLVGLTFIPNPEDKATINHINGIKTDNNISNLEWNTAKENYQHAVNTGLSNKGEKNGRSKLTEEQVLEIRSSNLKRKELAKIYNVSPRLISLIINNKIWKHISSC